MPKLPDSSAPEVSRPRRWSKNIDEASPACIVIDAFGGLTPFSKWTDFSPSTAHGWLVRGLIPQENWPWILDCARRAKVALTYRQFIDWRTIEPDF